MYVPNTERIRLKLTQWGSDVPRWAYIQALQKAQEGPSEPPEVPKPRRTPRKRSQRQ